MLRRYRAFIHHLESGGIIRWPCPLVGQVKKRSERCPRLPSLGQQRAVWHSMSFDSEDDDLRRAIALSLQGQDGGSMEDAIDIDKWENSENQAAGLGAENTTSQSKIVQSPPATLLGLDRRQMEAERLQRLKRKRQVSLSPPVPTPARPMHATSTRENNDARSAPVHFRGTDDFNDKVTMGDGKAPVYPRGVVKKTHVARHQKTDETIELEEVLDSEHLKLALLSSFQWDIPWLFSKLRHSETLITLVMQAKDEETKEQYRRETAENRHLRLCFPPMDAGPGCMHSKLMLLSFPLFLRLVIPTANLVAYDWGETGVMENMVFLIDLPRLPKHEKLQSASDERLTHFGQQLFRFVQAMNVESSIVESLLKFDYSATKNLAFVHTIGGSNMGADNPWRYTGHCGLANAVRNLNLTTDEPVQIDFVASSIGALKTDFLTQLYRACQGHSSVGEAEVANAKRKPKTSSKGGQHPREVDLDSHFRIYFPTKSTIDTVGAHQAGTICLQSKWYDAPTFPRQLFRNCESVRSKVLMHNKLLLVRHQPPQPQTQASSDNLSVTAPRRGAAAATSSNPAQNAAVTKKWAYLGSANCSESAWGNKVTRDRQTGMRKMYCRNWECGVVFPAEYPDHVDVLPSHLDKGQGDLSGNQSAVAGNPGRKLGTHDDDNYEEGGSQAGEEQRAIKIPIPMVFPGKKYGPSDRPWLYDEHRTWADGL